MSTNNTKNKVSGTGPKPLQTIPEEDHLLFVSSSRTLTVVDEFNNVTFEVYWEVTPPAVSNLPATYTVTVRKPSAGTLTNRIYSLWSLGIQSADFKVTVTAPATATLLDSQLATANKGGVVEATGKYFDGKKAKRFMPYTDKIEFVRFDSEGPHRFTVVEDGRLNCGFTTWQGGSVGEGHDNTPPTSEPN
jgi:hypothetical protein